MRLSVIAALSTNNVIGRDNGVPWRLSTDMKRYKALTMGHHLLTGRKTFESVGRPLPGRTTVVITRDTSYRPEGVIVVGSLEEAVRVARERGDDEAFLNGGAQVYAQSMHLADRMYLTRVHAEVEGDAFFPDFDDVSEWHLVDSEHFEADEKNEYPFSFLTYERAGGAGHAIPDEG
ncbi:MAG TPA: dihydrofolate reductase [Thermoanaerobaculia bacterium]|nr:dihydrofolate reductase [Thermoanaerobaculia bacterium]